MLKRKLLIVSAAVLMAAFVCSATDHNRIVWKDADQIARNLATKLITYGTGATVQFADREVVEEIVRTVRATGFGFRALIHEVVRSRVFLSK